jgi:hypothetical protein
MYYLYILKQNNMNTNETLSKVQFDRERHGGLYDRGSSDSYYGRRKDPHWYPEGTYHGERVTNLTQEEIDEYNLGYDENSDFKDWGE